MALAIPQQETAAGQTGFVHPLDPAIALPRLVFKIGSLYPS